MEFESCWKPFARNGWEPRFNLFCDACRALEDAGAYIGAHGWRLVTVDGLHQHGEPSDSDVEGRRLELIGRSPRAAQPAAELL